MKLRCNLCPYGSPRTSDLKLRTINGRDYLVCKNCDSGDYRHEESNGQEHISGIQKDN